METAHGHTLNMKQQGDPQMPSALAFDTLAYAKKLKAAGFTELQAEVQTEALVEIVEGRLATRQNLKETETSLRHDMKEIEASLKLDIEGVRQNLKETEAALRRDMKEIEASLKLDIEGVRRDMKGMETSLRNDMKEMEQRLTIRLGSLIATSIIIVAALVKLL